jgi:transmembrane sensor
MSTLAASNDRARLNQAADWLLRLRVPNVAPELVAEWLDWCARDAANRSAFDRMQDLWEASDGVPGLKEAAAALLIEKPDAPSACSSKLHGQSRKLGAGHWALAAMLLVAIAGVIAWYGDLFGTRVSRGGMYASQLETSSSQVKSFVLPDGSQVSLGGHSVASITYDPKSRRVALRNGEAFFSVRSDKSRPFIVSAGDLTVTAIGTAFNVRHDAGSVFVTVAEGTVDVSGRRDRRASQMPEFDVRARGGHQVRYQNGRIWSSVERVDPAIASSFTQGKLQYIDEPLSAVIASVNRYASRPIKLEDRALGDLHFTGTVFQDHIDDWVRGLDAVFLVRVTETESEIVLSRRF